MTQSLKPNACRTAEIEKRKSGNKTDEECLKSNCEFYDALHFMVGYRAPKNDTSTNFVTKRNISNYLYIFISAQIKLNIERFGKHKPL